jgi:AcrR family transcriptional regulator
MSEARARLLQTATALFYAEGLHAVGIDRIISEAGVTRATLYRHFPSKDDLVVAYLMQAHESIRSGAETARSQSASADDALLAIGRAIAGDIQSPGFRGCAFLNAAAEYPDPAHPVHQAVLTHRNWFLDTITALFTEANEENPDAAARHFVMLRDGAMGAGCLTDPRPISETLLLGIEGLLRFGTRKR